MPRRNRNVRRRTSAQAGLLIPLMREMQRRHRERQNAWMPHLCTTCGLRLPADWPYPQHSRCRFGTNQKASTP